MQGRTMKRSVIVVSLVVGTSCGGKSEPAEYRIADVGEGVSGIGDCVDPAPASARAWAMGVDNDGDVLVCRDDAMECRAIDLATGRMSGHYPKLASAEYDKPGAVVEDDGQLLVCWGQTSCRRRTPAAYEKWLQAIVHADSVAVLSSESEKKFVTTMDHDLTTVRRFEVAPGAADVVWRDDRFVVHANENGETHAYLYDGKGHLVGVVGAIGGKPALDVGPGPVDVAPSAWAFLASDASAVAVHDFGAGAPARIDVGEAQPAGLSDLSAAGEGRLAVALGGARYGDILIVDVDAKTVKPLAAKRCEVP
jgi:YD repeat-containing protein